MGSLRADRLAVIQIVKIKYSWLNYYYALKIFLIVNKFDKTLGNVVQSLSSTYGGRFMTFGAGWTRSGRLVGVDSRNQSAVVRHGWRPAGVDRSNASTLGSKPRLETRSPTARTALCCVCQHGAEFDVTRDRTIDCCEYFGNAEIISDRLWLNSGWNPTAIELERNRFNSTDLNGNFWWNSVRVLSASSRSHAQVLHVP